MVNKRFKDLSEEERTTQFESVANMLRGLMIDDPVDDLNICVEVDTIDAYYKGVSKPLKTGKREITIQFYRGSDNEFNMNN